MPLYDIKVQDAEIDDVLAWAMEKGRFPGMTYEDGVEAALLWVTGQTDERPDSE